MVKLLNIGIDFGSTYSTVSKADNISQFAVALSPAQSASPCIPSVVSINRNHPDQILCGNGAKMQVGRSTVRIFEAFKMLLLEHNDELIRSRGYDAEYTPRKITKLFLESILTSVLEREAEAGNSYDGFDTVYICMPELWANPTKSEGGRRVLREILLQEINIPINKVDVVTEPEAASAFFAYNYEQETKQAFNGYLLLIDYGGGTLDLTLTEVVSNGQGSMEIIYRESGGDGENHPDANGNCRIGRAGIAYMQDLLHRALRDRGLLAPTEAPDYTSPAYRSAFQLLETQLTTAELMKKIEATFSEYGSYDKVHKILKEPDRLCTTVEYQYEEVEISYQQMYLSYRDIVEEVLKVEVSKINKKITGYIGTDPCQPSAGRKGDFKIALVGGFGSFYLVKQQLSQIYHLDDNPKADKRTKNISADKREQAISLGAALLAAKKLALRKTARYSIGVYSSGSGTKGTLAYGIKFHQEIEPNVPYFLLRDNNLPDTPDNRIQYGGLRTHLTDFAIEFSEKLNEGGLMNLKKEHQEKLHHQVLPRLGFWNLAFSMDEDDVVTMHIIPANPENTGFKAIKYVFGSYEEMFELTAIKKVVV